MVLYILENIFNIISLFTMIVAGGLLVFALVLVVLLVVLFFVEKEPQWRRQAERVAIYISIVFAGVLSYVLVKRKVLDTKTSIVLFISCAVLIVLVVQNDEKITTYQSLVAAVAVGALFVVGKSRLVNPSPQELFEEMSSKRLD